jgi:phage terminase large subunit-like protein
VTVEFLAEQLAAPGLKRFKTAVLHGNLWAQGDRCWLPVDAWAGCAEAGACIPLGSPVWIGVDVAVRQDPSAVVMLWRRDDVRVVVKAKIWHPPEEGFRLSVIEDYIAGLAEEYAIQAVAAASRWIAPSSSSG